MVTSHVCLRGHPAVFISFYYLERVSVFYLIPETVRAETATMTKRAYSALGTYSVKQKKKRKRKGCAQEMLQDVRK